MKKPTAYCVCLLVIGYCAGCKPEPQTLQSLFPPDIVKSESFIIKNDVDTILRTNSGVILQISKGTFPKTNAVGTVKITVKEALSKGDMVLAGLNTIARDGATLESGGMVYWEISPEQPTLLHPVTFRLPTKSFLEGAQLFSLNPENIRAGWDLLHDLENTPQTKKITDGRQLYMTNCAACHSTDLKATQTGPALGNIHLFRSEDWLIRYTNSSQQMIAEGDTIALCLWEQWKPVIMPYFHLTDDQIRSIYAFIKNESIIQQIDSNEVKYITTCSLPANASFSSAVVSSPIALVDSAFIDLFYTFSTEKWGWLNVDRYLKWKSENTPSIDEVGKIRVRVKNMQELQFFQVFMVYKKKDIVLDLVFRDDTFGMYWDNKELDVPKGEATLVVLGRAQNDNGYRLGYLDIYVGEQTLYELSPQAASLEETKKILTGLGR